MTATAGGATVETAGVLEVGATSPATDYTTLTPEGDSTWGYWAFWTLAIATDCFVTIDSSPTAGTDAVMLIAFEGDWDEPTLLVQSDNFPAFPAAAVGQASLTFTGLAGTTYIVNAGTNPDGPGVDYQLAVSTEPIPASGPRAGGADWSTATAIPVGLSASPTYRANLVVGDTSPHWQAWWTITPNVDRTITLSTAESVNLSGYYLNTYLEVFTGSDYASRVLVAEAEDPGEGATLTFEATADETYHVAVGTPFPTQLVPDIFGLTVDWGAGPVGLSVTFDGSDIEISSDLGAAYQFADDGLVMPAKQARIRYAADSDWTHGSVALASSWQQSLLTLRVRVEGSSETDLASKVAELEEAIGQFSYDVTVTRDAQTSTWRADQGSMSLDQSRRFYSDQFVEVWAVTIPVYPIPS